MATGFGLVAIVIADTGPRRTQDGSRQRKGIDMPPEIDPNAPPATPPPADAPPAPAPKDEPTTVDRKYHLSEVDKYRNQFGQEKKRADELEAKLGQIEDANKTELQKLQEKAKKYDDAEPELTALRTTITAEVEAQKAKLPKELADLLPAGTPQSQLEWIRKASAVAPTLKPGQQQLPPSGSRNPVGGPVAGDAANFEKQVKLYPSLGRRKVK